MANKYRIRNYFKRYKSQLNVPKTLKFFQQVVEIFQSIIHELVQKRWCQIFGELIQSNTNTGNLFEPVISIIHITSKRQIQIISLEH